VMPAMRSSARRCAIVRAATGTGGGAGAARTPDGATKTDALAGFLRAHDVGRVSFETDQSS
jgi:hypothetical protein